MPRFGGGSSAPSSSTRARVACRRRPAGRSLRSGGSAARPAGTTAAGCGSCAGCWTCSSAGRACAAAAATPIAPRRRGGRLLARRGLRAGSAPAALGRDAVARPGLAAVRGRRRRGRLDREADGDLRSRRAGASADWYALWPLHQLVFRGMLEASPARGHVRKRASPGRTRPQDTLSTRTLAEFGRSFRASVDAWTKRGGARAARPDRVARPCREPGGELLASSASSFARPRPGPPARATRGRTAAVAFCDQALCVDQPA